VQSCGRKPDRPTTEQAKPLGGGVFLRRFILALAGLLVFCASASGALQAPVGKKATAVGRTTEAQRQAAIQWLGGQVYGYQRATWRWEQLMGAHKTPTEGRVLTEMSISDVQRAVVLWKRRASAARRLAERPPHMAQFLCIHRFEGSWTDSGAPYYGGLQMDLGGSLDTARADLDGGKSCQEQGFLSLAEHCEVLRPALTSPPHRNSVEMT